MTTHSSDSAYQQLARPDFLELAWHRINRTNPKSCGLDGETIKHFSDRLRSKLRDLSQSLKNETFRFQPLKGVTIPKADGTPRPLRIPAVKDRIVLKALQIFLEPRLSPLNAPFSYAYKSKDFNKDQYQGGVFRAIDHARELGKRYAFVLEADIKSYFETVNKERLSEILFKVQKLSSLKKLLQDAIDLETKIGPTVADEDMALFENDERGIPQGSALSPLLANLYLSNFDLEMTQAGWEMLRYADDIIIFAETEERARSAYTKARNLLISMGLSMHELSSGSKAKTKINRTNSDGVEFVGFRAQANRIFPGSKTLGKFRTDIREMTTVEKFDGKSIKKPLDRNDSILSRATSIRNKTGGKAASLACCDECQEISQLSAFVEDRFIGMFERLGLSFPDRDPQRLKRIGVPNLFEIWRDRRDSFLKRKVVPLAQESDAISWASRNRNLLISAFRQTQVV